MKIIVKTTKQDLIDCLNTEQVTIIDTKGNIWSGPQSFESVAKQQSVGKTAIRFNMELWRDRGGYEVDEDNLDWVIDAEGGGEIELEFENN